MSDQGSRDWIGAPLTAAQRRAWRDKIGGCWKWSQALPGESASRPAAVAYAIPVHVPAGMQKDALPHSHTSPLM